MPYRPPRSTTASPMPFDIKRPLPYLASLAPIAYSSRLPAFLFFATAAATGVLFSLIISSTFSSPANRSSLELPDGYWKTVGIEANVFEPECGSGNIAGQYIRPGLGMAIEPAEDVWTMTRITQAAKSTKGYYVRDWSLTLGWNNLRYILEASMLHAKMLNRTLVVPSFVYARSCEFELAVCAQYATQIHRDAETGMGDFIFLSEEKQQAWKLPISLMIDLPRLREIHPVVTIAEYLRIHNLPVSLERKNGQWDREAYHDRPKSLGGRISFDIFYQVWFEPTNVVRVDRVRYKLPPGPPESYEEGEIFKALKEVLGDGKAIDLDTAQALLKKQGLMRWKNQEDFEKQLQSHGWAILHTFRGVWMEMLKAVDQPVAQIAMISQLRGIMDEYDDKDAEVLLLEGEVHSNTKPGHLRFTTPEARTDFAGLVLKGVRPIPPIRELAERLARRLQDMNEGRQWMSAHMRRGDFVTFGWVPESSLEAHLTRIKARLASGLAVVEEIYNSKRQSTVDVPGITPDKFFEGAPPPLPNDRFFIATDERTPEGLQYIRSEGAVVIDDLLTSEDRRIVGWPLLVTDVVAQLEQIVASHGVYFWAHSMSSVGGDVVNLRAARGMDPRTSQIEKCRLENQRGECSTT